MRARQIVTIGGVAMLLLALGSSLGGCQCGGPRADIDQATPRPDAGPAADQSTVVDLHPDANSEPDLRPDRRLPPDLRPDSGPDQGVPDLNLNWDSCGGSRKLSPIPVKPHTPKPCGKGCKQVTFDTFVQNDYVVSGDLLVYVGRHNAGGEEVHLVDLKAGTEVRLSPFAAQPYGCTLAATDGKKIGYTCIRSGYYSPAWLRTLSLYDPTTGIEEDTACIVRQRKKGPCFPSSLALADTGIALNMSLGTCSTIDVLLNRLSDGKVVNLSNKNGGVFHVAADGHRIIWTGWDKMWGSAHQIAMYDTKTGKVTPVSLSPGNPQYRARVQGDKVIWTENRDGKGNYLLPLNSDIYARDLSTGKTVAVTTHAGTQEWPDIHGDWAVWHDWRHSKGGTSSGGGKEVDIYAKNLKTGKEYRLTDFKGVEAYPRVDNGRVFFTMGGNKTISIFMIDLKVRLGL